MPRTPKSKKIIEAAWTANSYQTLAITAAFVRAGRPLLEVGPAFMEAHEALGIQLKWDRPSNHGWVTTEEAKAIIAYMTEHWEDSSIVETRESAEGWTFFYSDGRIVTIPND
jgi:hypothetical protein